MKKLAALVALSVCMLLCSKAMGDLSTLPAKNTPPSASDTPVDPDVSKFLEVVEAADLRKLFQGSGPFTFFIPSNEAFEKFGADRVKLLERPENKDKLTEIVLYHVVPGLYPSKNLKTRELSTLGGRRINIEVENDEITVNGAKVVKKDIPGHNGIVYIIDRVMTPP